MNEAKPYIYMYYFADSRFYVIIVLVSVSIKERAQKGYTTVYMV